MSVPDYPGAFAALREILCRHSARMIVLADTAADYTLATQAMGSNGKPIWFGAVLRKKSAVTYHLYPLYFNPKLQSAIPAELLRRKQGKTCFNFQRPDAALFEMLDELTGQARDNFERHGLLEAGPVSPERLDAMLRAGGEDPQALATLRKEKAARAAARRAATIRKQGGKSRRTRPR
jgi:hypothetical protein